MPLKNRAMQIPQGLSYHQPETSWRPNRFCSFDSIVDQVISHRLGNPHLIHKNGWSVDRAQVETEVDNYNSAVCRQMGWFDYLQEGGQGPAPIPFPEPSRSRLQAVRQSLSAVTRGSFALVEWIKDGAEAVAAALSECRAQVCSQCPLNQQGDWTRIFTVPVSNAIRSELNRRRELKLSTSVDAQLGICSACDCPIPLMVHLPLERKLQSLSPESHGALDARCWILKEERGG